MADAATNRSTVILVTRDGMGSTEAAELRHKLLDTYFKLLIESNMLPGAVCFYTDGIKMVIEDSPMLDTLSALEERGVHLIVCKTCLDYFGLADKISVGVVGGMTDIIAAQWQAEKVITL